MPIMDAALKLQALAVAVKAEGFSKFLREDGPENHHPNPDDYAEMAHMIRRLISSKQ